MRRTPEPQNRTERFEALFRAEYPTVAQYIGRRSEPDVVDDLVNEVFIVAWRRLERVPAEPRAWLLRVARNVIGTHIRGARRSRALTVRLALTEVDWTQPPPKVDGGEMAAALAGLPEKDREALMLVSWDGLSPSEAAVVLGERPASFRVRLHRARRRLARAIERPVQAPAPKTHLDELNIRTEVPHA